MDDYRREIMELPYKNLYSYWQHYWSNCIDNLIDKDNVSFKIVGPRMLLKDLIEEIDGHDLYNQENIAYFRNQIRTLDKNDEVFHTLCHPIVVCLLQRLGNKNNKESSIILCKKILDTLVVKQYFTLLVDWLADTIDKTSINDYSSRKKINEITHLVIAEYVAEGFLLDEIKSFATEIPGVAIAVGGIVMAAPPEFDTLKESDFSTQEEYYEAVFVAIKKRSVYKSLDELKHYYYEPPREAFFIVRLNGLKGQIDDYIGDINIYSPKIKRYITENNSLSQVETVTEDRDRVNAAIPIEFVSLYQAKVLAEAKLEEVLDMLMLTYRTKEPVTIATNFCAVVADGKEISWSHSVRGNDPLMLSKDEMSRYLDALDLTDVKKDDFQFMTEKHRIFEVGQDALKRRLKNAAHWYTKAIAADKGVDTLLYSWFAIEGLLKVNRQTQSEIVDKDPNSLKVIQEFVISIFCKRYPFNYLRRTYRNFIYLTNQHDNYYDITKDVINKAGLNIKEGDCYRDGEFLKAIPNMIECVNDDIVKDELADLHSFYQSDKVIKNKAEQLKNDLLMIYRLRNMIVHNAALSCANLSFYAREAKWIAQLVIRYVIDHASGNKTIEEIVLGAKLDYQMFLQNFDVELKRIKNGE